MKKLQTILLVIIFLLSYTGITLAANQIIPIAEVLGSPNSETANPAQYLIDGDTNTGWRAATPNQNPAWVELQLAVMAKIEGLQIYGPFNGQLKIEYWQDGGWHHFLADSLSGATLYSGWNLIDLSYDRIVTDRLRLWLDNPGQAVWLGGINEIKVIGYGPGTVIERLAPVSINSNNRTETAYPADSLFDHNTHTSWWVKSDAMTDGEAVAALGGPCLIQKIKIFGCNTEELTGGADDHFRVEYFQNNNWTAIPGLENLSAGQIGKAWTSFDLTDLNLATDQIRLVMAGPQRCGGIREIELWGQRSQPDGSRYLSLSGGTDALTVGTPANYQFTYRGPSYRPIDLQIAGQGQPGTPLTWELNGKPQGELSTISTYQGFTIYQQAVKPNDLWDEANYLKISGGDFTITDCRVELAADNGLQLSGSSLTDRRTLSPVPGGETILNLFGTYQLDQLSLHYLGNPPQIQLAILQPDGQWVNVTTLPQVITGVAGGELIYSGIGLTCQIRINGGNPLDSLTEAVFYGSLINDGNLLLRIITPQDGECHSLAEWLGMSLRGTIDNPDAALSVNGLSITPEGTSFTVPFQDLNLTDLEEKLIQAVATDATGRSGSQQVTIMVGQPPELTVDLPEGTSYTQEAQITVSGQVSSNCTVTINGAEASVFNRYFTTTVSLEEGLNSISVIAKEASLPKLMNVKSFRVIRNNRPPSLQVLSPADGQVISAATIIVSGEATSLNPIRVEVNGQAAIVDGGSFHTAPLSLQEGDNQLVVTATDQTGLTSQVILTVQRDSTPPQISNVSPLDGVYLNTVTLTVSGEVSDAASVLVNGKAAIVSGNTFSAVVLLAEGGNDIKIEVRDRAGNQSIINRRVYCDTIAPQGLTLTADSSGWTNNDRPTVTFNAADEASGLDHYELRVDNGVWINPAASPHTFAEPLTDGEHLIQVKAVDKAGNAAEATVTVQIDTMAPAVPEQFEIIPGIGRVIIRWLDAGGEVIGYRIKRTPAFADSEYRTVMRSADLPIIYQYQDREVSGGVQYTYTLQAIDRAGNVGSATTPDTVTAGITVKPMSSAGGTVKFDNCAVTFAANALAAPQTSGNMRMNAPMGQTMMNAAETPSAEYQVVMQEETISLPENEFGLKLGSAYRFSLVDQGGQPVETEFTEPVTLTVSYADMQIPAGYLAKDLGVYWWNEQGEYWEKLDYAEINMNAKQIKVTLRHFSNYQVMASQYVSPSPDYYYNLGISPYGSYLQDNAESVSTQSGSLSVTATDLKLPGRNGFDLIIKRLFDSGATGYSSPNEPVVTFNNGWSLNIPWLESRDNGRYLRLEDGRTIKIEWKDNQFECHEGTHFILKNIVPGYNVSSGGHQFTVKNMLTLADGTVYEFNAGGKPCRKLDPTGRNENFYEYNGAELTKITDSLGRIITFNYINVGSKRFIGSIRADNRTISYQYNSATAQLTGATDPMGRKTGYKYDGKMINEIDYPSGGVSKYSFQNQDSKILVTKHTLFAKAGDTAPQKTVSYNYNLNSAKYVVSTTVTEGKKKIVENYRQLIKKNNSYSLTTTVNNANEYKGDLPVSRIIYNDTITYETVNMKYENQSNLALRLANKEEHVRGGNITYTIVNNYDNWGNPTYRRNDYTRLEETWSYHSHARIKYLVETSVKTNPNPLDGTATMVTTSYQYNDTLGKAIRMTVNDGNQTLVTSYTYDDYGNLKSRTEPNQLVTEFVYDSAKSAFPARKTARVVRDADGNATDIITEYGYNLETGMKEWEKDPRGYVTYYQYDALNRVIAVTLPDDDANPENNPQRRYLFHDDQNTCEFFNEKNQKTLFSFDGLGRLVQITKYLGGNQGASQEIDSYYHYDDLGRIDEVTDPRGFVTRYRYEPLNRISRVTYPDDTPDNPDDNPYAMLQYNDLTNTVTITDENGGWVTERSDWANRLVEAHQYCGYTDLTTENHDYLWQFAYDALGNKLRQINPVQGQVNQRYDPLGRLQSISLPAANLIKPNTSELTSNVRPVSTYEYDVMGNRTAATNPNGNTVRYEYDQLGRPIKAIAVSTDMITGQTVTAVTKTYYDAAGNKVKTTDPNGHDWTYTYSARGYLISETDPLGNVTRYQYDSLGNKIAVTDPRGNGTDGKFTTWYLYDDLNRLRRTVLPDGTPPAAPYMDTPAYDNPYIEITYDVNGNKLTERDANGVITSYTYTARNWLKTVSVNGQKKQEFAHDKKGNQIKTTDALGNTIQNKYDSLNRLRKVKRFYQEENRSIEENYTYDPVGNRTSVKDGQSNTTFYSYNSLGWLTGIRDPLQNFTEFRYDPCGNQVKQIAANNLATTNIYDERNRLVEQIDSLQHTTKYGYDMVGNRNKIIDRRGTAWAYQYLDNNLLQRLDLTGTDGTSYYVEYAYDEAGNRQRTTDSGNTVLYNYQDGTYQTDPLNRVNSIDRNFDGAVYRTVYQYSPAGLLTKIKYPGTDNWLEYQYDNQNRLTEVVAFTAPQGITYNANNAVTGLTYANGIQTNFTYDSLQRLTEVVAAEAGETGPQVFKEHYTFDDNSNIISINNQKFYEYDKNNQLTKAVAPGTFLEDQKTEGIAGAKIFDYPDSAGLNFDIDQQAVVKLDYNSSSIGLDFGTVVPGIKKIVLTPGQNYQNHRVTDKTIEIYSTTAFNTGYAIIPRNEWDYQKNNAGTIAITLRNRKAARYLKVHVKFDDRDWKFQPVDKATFLNTLAQTIQVYQEATSRTEEYQYDAAGNRKLLRLTLIHATNLQSLYYSNSDRLKTDGKYAFAYDAAGNMVQKGNKFIVSGDTVAFETSGEGVEYWQYGYDLLNRLIRVKKNGTVVAEYAYDPEGLRVVKQAAGKKIHFVFEGTEPIFEKRITENKIRSYVYSLGKHLARVDGVIGDSSANVYWYTTDQVGSVKAVTDNTGTVVFNADYYAFGTKYQSNGEFDELHGFTGKEYDPDIGLYYYNARWYDSETGRFMSEDPVVDPNNPNLYSYCANNPLTHIDPTGLDVGWYGEDHQGGNSGYNDGNYTQPDPNDYSWSRNPGGSSGGNNNITQKQINDFWNNENYFTPHWWQDPEKKMQALMMLDIEMRLIGPGAFVRSDRDIDPHKIEAVQAGLGVVRVNGIYDDKTADAIRQIQGIAKMPNAKDTVVGTRTIDLLIERAIKTEEYYKNHPTLKAINDFMEQGHIGDAFLSAAILGGYYFGQKGVGAGETQISRTRLPQDINVDPNPPIALGTNRLIGPNAAQNAQLQADIRAARSQGATDIRVNQQQVNASGERVGVNRPDLQYTLGGQRVYIEYDTNPTNGVAHGQRIMSNDSQGNVILKTIK